MRRMILTLLLTLCGAAHAQVVPVYRPPAASTWGVPLRPGSAAAPTFRPVVPTFRRAPPVAEPAPLPRFVGPSGQPVTTIGAPSGVRQPDCFPVETRTLALPPIPGLGLPEGGGPVRPATVVAPVQPVSPPPVTFGPPAPTWGVPQPTGRTLNVGRAVAREAIRPHAIAALGLEGVGISVAPPLAAGPPAPTPRGAFPPAVGGPPPGALTPNYAAPANGTPPSVSTPLPLAPAWLGQPTAEAQVAVPNSRALGVVRRQREQVSGVQFGVASGLSSAVDAMPRLTPPVNNNGLRRWSTCPGGAQCGNLQSRAYRAGDVSGASTVCVAGQACLGRGGVAIDYWQGGRTGEVDGLPSGQTSAVLQRLRPGSQTGADAIVDRAAASQGVVSPARIGAAYNDARREVLNGSATGTGMVLPTWQAPGPSIGPVR